METTDREIAIGQYLTMRRPPKYGPAEGNFIEAREGYSELRFQNFWIGENAILQDIAGLQSHSFLPFGFSGVTVDRAGGNVDAQLVLPNNALSRTFVDQSVKERWTAVVRVCLIDNLEDSSQTPQTLYRYVGQVSAGAWNDTELQLVLNSVLDAVQTNLPARTLQPRLVGNLPVSGTISL